MYNRWYNVTVTVFWLATMTWLVMFKVLPPMLPGEPPSLPAILKAQQAQPVVGWNLFLNDAQVGYALSTTVPMNDGTTEYRGRLHIDRLPLEQLTASWMNALTKFSMLSRLIGTTTNTLLGSTKLQMDVRSAMTIDSLGHLMNIRSTLRMDPVGELVRIDGTVQGKKLLVSLRWSDSPDKSTYDREIPLGSLVGEDFTPKSQLPGLYLGQTWTEPSYNPLQFNDPLEVVRATVEGPNQIIINDTQEEVWVVVYRSDSGMQLGSDHGVHARLWVRPDGTVLRQKAYLFDSSMFFERLSDAEALEKLKLEENRAKISE
jgi:hypothetical protein